MFGDEIRKEAGIKDIRNGEHRLLQKQIDLLHEDVKEISKCVKHQNIISAKNEAVSALNFKLIVVLFTAFAGLVYVIL